MGMRRMQFTTKVFAKIILVFLMLSMVQAAIPIISAAAPSIALTPTLQAPGASVSVEGTGFGTSKAIAIGFGAEVAVANEVVSQTGSGYGPYTGTVANRPVKPGTAKFTIDVADGLVTYVVTDIGNGTLTSTSLYFANGTINYVTGQYVRYATSDPTTYTIVVTAAYTRYQNGVTPAAGTNTTASGSFTASITVPSVANGNYNVTTIDTQGNLATATLGVDATIPESSNIAAIVLLSSLAVIVSFRFLRKQSKTGSFSSMKLMN
jgi:hypothetical protein